jgi:hypothetical protein
MESSSELVRVALDDACFVESVQRYIEEDKPDPLQQKQMKSWRIEWENNDTLATNGDLAFIPTHAVGGTLNIQGEYMIVTLTTECCWTGDCSNGSLFFSCHASCSFVAEESQGENEPKMSSKERKQQEKIRSKMVERLRQDDYISKLLVTDNDEQQSPLELCQAAIVILQAQDRLEERVHCDEVTAEAVRRAVFSTAESPLDVFDLVCRLPLLPCTTTQDLTGSTTTKTTPLADRAKLRMLEDATYDACENEAEDEIVEELNIVENTVECNKKKKKR